MRYSADPERQIAFQHTLEQPHLPRGTSVPFTPWQNGIVERSDRADNEELVHVLRFARSEERRYQLRRREQEYDWRRPHQALDGLTPMAMYLQEYPAHATSRMLV